MTVCDAAAVLSIQRLSVGFGSRTVIHDLSSSAARGENLAVIGPNGSGKTVLLRAQLNQLPHKGEIRWATGTKLGYVPQMIAADRAAVGSGFVVTAVWPEVSLRPVVVIIAALLFGLSLLKRSAQTGRGDQSSTVSQDRSECRPLAITRYKLTDWNTSLASRLRSGVGFVSLQWDGDASQHFSADDRSRADGDRGAICRCCLRE